MAIEKHTRPAPRSGAASGSGWLMACAAAAVLAGCGGGGGGGGAGNGGNGGGNPGIVVSSSLSTVTVQPPLLPADGVSECVVTIRLLDADGGPAAGRPVEIRPRTPAPAGLSIDVPAPTGADGRTEARMTSTDAVALVADVVVDPGTAAPVTLAAPVQVEFTAQPVVPAVAGPATFEDVDRSGTPSAGDRIVVRFDVDVRLDGATVADFALPSAGDSFGSGASVTAGASPTDVVVELGTNPVLRTRGLFDASVPGNDNLPSGLRLATRSNRIVSVATGDPAEPGAAPVDLVAGLSDESAAVPTALDGVPLLFDYDRDGDVDLVVGGAAGLTFRRGDGRGAFAADIERPHAPVRALAHADVDGDGLQDLVVVSDDGLEVLRNRTTRPSFTTSFQSLLTLARNDAFDAVCGDFDLDGDLDVALAADGAGVVVVQLAGAQVASVRSVPGTADARALALVRADRDAFADLVVGRTAGGATLLLTGRGGNGFDVSGLQGPADTDRIAAADVDGDGLDDWLTRSERGAVALALSTAGHRSADLGSSNNSAAVDVALADLDLDGRAEPLTLERADGGGVVAQPWARGASSGSFARALAYAAPPASEALRTADFDRDGALDVLLGDGGDRIAVRFGAAGAGFGLTRFDRAPEAAVQGSSFGGLARGDFDGDGIDDLAVGGFGASSDQNLILRGDGNGGFAPSGATFGARNTHDVAAADFDLDGDLDLVVANSEFETGQQVGGPSPNELWLNDGSGNFSLGATFDDSPSLKLGVGDLDGDGTPDIVVANRGSTGTTRRNRVFLVTVTAPGAPPTLTEKTDAFGTASNPDNLHDSQAVALGDVDGDGDLDLMVGNDDTQVQLWRNAGDGSFALVRQIGSQSTRSLALADLDRDGDLDLVVGTFRLGGNAVPSRVFPGTAAIDFGQPVDLPNQANGMLINDLVVVDVDGDGALDVVGGNGNFSQSDRIWFGDGMLGFPRDLEIQGTSSTAGLVAVDGDRDGDLDLARAERNDLGVRVVEHR